MFVPNDPNQPVQPSNNGPLPDPNAPQENQQSGAIDPRTITLASGVTMGYQQFNAAYELSVPPALRALRSIVDPSAREVAMRSYAISNTDGLDAKGTRNSSQWPVDAHIDVDFQFGTPFDCTYDRLMYGTRSVMGWSGDSIGTPTGTVIPVPPTLTPYPDPPAKPANQYVGAALDPIKRPGIFKKLDGAPTILFGLKIRENDGHWYVSITQQFPSDPINLFQLIG